MKKGILLHQADDDVGVAALDLKAGEKIQAVTLEGEPVSEIELVTDIPLAHKVAMRDLDAEKDILEYGSLIGYASTSIAAGSHVHTHNLKSRRWSGKSQIVDHDEEGTS
jgi:(2R)-sulfolactate sulfo-lyase subunit alpha